MNLKTVEVGFSYTFNLESGKYSFPQIMKQILFIFIWLVSVDFLFPQENEKVIHDLIEKFRDFEYQQVIETADTLLKKEINFSNPDQIEIYRMKGISHYALLDDSEARLSFIEILRIDTSYILDPASTSPKIINFFKEIKSEYLASIRGKEEKIVVMKYDTVYVAETFRDTIAEYNLKQAIVRSVFIPGTGHLYLKSDIKSWVLTFLSVASISTGIYYIIDAAEKEKIYLQERDPNNISEKYNDYNFAYRMRNLSFISFAAIWIYSQIDLLFFIEKENPGIYSYLPKVFVNPGSILLNYQVRF